MHRRILWLRCLAVGVDWRSIENLICEHGMCAYFPYTLKTLRVFELSKNTDTRGSLVWGLASKMPCKVISC